MRPLVQGLAAYRDREPAHAELAPALVAELRPLDAGRFGTGLRRLAGAAELTDATAPRGQPEQIAATVLRRVALPDRRPADDSDLMVDTAWPAVAAPLSPRFSRPRWVAAAASRSASSATAGGTSWPTEPWRSRW